MCSGGWWGRWGSRWREDEILLATETEDNFEEQVPGDLCEVHAIFPPRLEPKKDVAVFSLTVRLPGEEVDSGYGALWPEEGRGLPYYVGLAEGAGFEVVSQRAGGRQLYLALRKPAPPPL